MMFLVSLVFPDSSKRPLEKKIFIKSKDLQACKIAEPSISVVPCSREEKKRTQTCVRINAKHNDLYTFITSSWDQITKQ
jgi:hypothetical protein